MGIGTGQTQGSQTIQYGYDNALAGLNFLNTGLQSTNTFGAATATNGLTAATNTATFGSAAVPYGFQGLNYGLGLGQESTIEDGLPCQCISILESQFNLSLKDGSNI